VDVKAPGVDVNYENGKGVDVSAPGVDLNLKSGGDASSSPAK
jgi:hypothetical protein